MTIAELLNQAETLINSPKASSSEASRLYKAISTVCDAINYDDLDLVDRCIITRHRLRVIVLGAVSPAGYWMPSVKITKAMRNAMPAINPNAGVWA